MDDKDVTRLEDRISSSEERAQLRLEVAMAKIDGKLDLISANFVDVKVTLAEVRTQGRETRNVIIIAAAAIISGVLGVEIALRQVWIGGVQVGQVSQETAKKVSGPALQAPE